MENTLTMTLSSDHEIVDRKSAIFVNVRFWSFHGPKATARAAALLFLCGLRARSLSFSVAIAAPKPSLLE